MLMLFFHYHSKPTSIQSLPVLQSLPSLIALIYSKPTTKVNLFQTENQIGLLFTQNLLQHPFSPD